MILSMPYRTFVTHRNSLHKVQSKTGPPLFTTGLSCESSPTNRTLSKLAENKWQHLFSNSVSRDTGQSPTARNYTNAVSPLKPW